jgi:hypothetical protein
MAERLAYRSFNSCRRPSTEADPGIPFFTNIVQMYQKPWIIDNSY